MWLGKSGQIKQRVVTHDLIEYSRNADTDARGYFLLLLLYLVVLGRAFSLDGFDWCNIS